MSLTMATRIGGTGRAGQRGLRCHRCTFPGVDFESAVIGSNGFGHRLRTWFAAMQLAAGQGVGNFQIGMNPQVGAFFIVEERGTASPQPSSGKRFHELPALAICSPKPKWSAEHRSAGQGGFTQAEQCSALRFTGRASVIQPRCPDVPLASRKKARRAKEVLDDLLRLDAVRSLGHRTRQPEG